MLRFSPASSARIEIVLVTGSERSRARCPSFIRMTSVVDGRNICERSRSQAKAGQIRPIRDQCGLSPAPPSMTLNIARGSPRAIDRTPSTLVRSSLLTIVHQRPCLAVRASGRSRSAPGTVSADLAGDPPPGACAVDAASISWDDIRYPADPMTSLALTVISTQPSLLTVQRRRFAESGPRTVRHRGRVGSAVMPPTCPIGAIAPHMAAHGPARTAAAGLVNQPVGERDRDLP